MKMMFSLIRDGVTSTCVSLEVEHVGPIQRILTSYLRMSGSDSTHYHLVAYGHIQDISATDFLEEITGSHTGSMFDVVNTRRVDGSHIELDLERLHGPVD